jgi:hypothetical protein
MRKALIPAVAALALALAGCGDDAEVASGPAAVMPAEMPLYVEATIRPEGEQAENLDALLTELGELPLIGSVGDPGDLIIEQLESEAEAAGVDFSYEEDVEPWLGERAGFGIAGPQDTEEAFVLAVETTDEDAARESIENLLSEDSVPYEEGEYEGVSYLAAPQDSYRLGVFDGHVVLAPADDFEAAVDATNDDSLAESEKLDDTLASLDEDRMVSFYLDLEGYAALAQTEEEAAEFEQAQEVAPEVFEGAIAFAAGISADDQVYFDTVSPLLEDQPEAGGSDLLGRAPGDAFAALALEDIGSFAPPIADLFERSHDAGADLEDFPPQGLEAAFEEEVGVTLDEAADAIGDASLWVRGDLPDEIEVAGEIAVSDSDVAADLIDAVEAEIEEEGGAELGPPVGGSDVGFSALETGPAAADVECSSIGDAAECLPTSTAHADLPFVNVELDGDSIRYGFFASEESAESSDPEGAGEFGETDVFTAGEEALGDEFEYVGAFDPAPLLEEVLPDASIADALTSPEALIAEFAADKLGVLAAGIRYEDDFSVQRYVLTLAD